MENNHRNRKKPRYGRKFKANDANRLGLESSSGVVSQELLLANFRKKDPASLGEPASAPTEAQNDQDVREFVAEPAKPRSAFFTEEFLDEIDANAARANRRIKTRSARRERPLPPESLELFVDDLG